jgi:hypothetical protein
MFAVNPLLLQITIGVGAFLLGFIVATLVAGKRVRNTRRAALQQADDHASAMAVKKLRIRELEAKLAGREADEERIDKLSSLQRVVPVQVNDTTWMTGRIDRPQGSPAFREGKSPNPN